MQNFNRAYQTKHLSASTDKLQSVTQHAIAPLCNSGAVAHKTCLCRWTWLLVSRFPPDNVHMRHLHRKGDKVALHTGRDVEGPSCGVHTGTVLGVGDLLEHNLDLVKPPTVVHTLADQLNSRLGVILVNKWHVHVINKVDQALRPRWSKTYSCISRTHGLQFVKVILLAGLCNSLCQASFRPTCSFISTSL